MSESSKLFLPHNPEDPSLEQQVHDLCCAAIQAAGGYLVDHPEDHTTIVVFGAHQLEVKVTMRR